MVMDDPLVVLVWPTRSPAIGTKTGTTKSAAATTESRANFVLNSDIFKGEYLEQV